MTRPQLMKFVMRKCSVTVHQGILRAVPSRTSVVVVEYFIHTVWYELGEMSWM